MKNIKKKIGRPSVMTESVVEKLKTALQRGATIEQACAYAMIDKGSYYNELKRNKSFSTEMASAQEYSNLVAKTVVVDKIIKDRDDVNARWWLEKREFRDKGTNVNIDNRQIHVIALPERDESKNTLDTTSETSDRTEKTGV